MKPTLALLFALAIFPSLALAQVGGSVHVGGTAAPWNLTDADRIAARTASRQPGGRARVSAVESGYHESLDGHRNPELFLPYELFDNLLEGLSTAATHRENAHKLFDSKLSAFRYDVHTFWTILGSAAQQYINTRDIHHQQSRLSTDFTSSTGKKSFVPIDRDVCSARIGALQDARRLLGGKDFDRFLYSVVAPELRIAEHGNAPERAEQLRFMAGGCK